MQAISEHEPQPAITWLNMSGDVTITWDDHNREKVLALVREKMAQGYSFFILKPRVISLLGNSKVKLKEPSQLDKAVGIVVPDSQIDALVAQMGDADVARGVKSGHLKLALVPKGELSTTRRAKSAEEVVRHKTVAVRAIVGG